MTNDPKRNSLRNGCLIRDYLQTFETRLLARRLERNKVGREADRRYGVVSLFVERGVMHHVLAKLYAQIHRGFQSRSMTTKSSYSRQELYTLWLRFKENHKATQILMDFSGLDQYHAQMLALDFWEEYQGPAPRIYPLAKIKESDFMW